MDSEGCIYMFMNVCMWVCVWKRPRTWEGMGRHGKDYREETWEDLEGRDMREIVGRKKEENKWNNCI